MIGRRFGAIAVGCLWPVLFVPACASTVPLLDRDSSTPPPSSFGGVPPLDPFDVDAALGARANALFARSCAGGPETVCHAAGAGGLKLLLGPGGDVVRVPAVERPDLLRVDPFDSAKSYLFLKVLGDGGIEGGRMPLDGEEDPRIPDLVGQWIEAGAPSP